MIRALITLSMVAFAAMAVTATLSQGGGFDIGEALRLSGEPETTPDGGDDTQAGSPGPDENDGSGVGTTSGPDAVGGGAARDPGSTGRGFMPGEFKPAPSTSAPSPSTPVPGTPSPTPDPTTPTPDPTTPTPDPTTPTPDPTTPTPDPTTPTPDPTLPPPDPTLPAPDPTPSAAPQG